MRYYTIQQTIEQKYHLVCLMSTPILGDGNIAHLG